MRWHNARSSARSGRPRRAERPDRRAWAGEHPGRPGRPDRGWASPLDDLLRHAAWGWSSRQSEADRLGEWRWQRITLQPGRFRRGLAIGSPWSSHRA